MGKTTYDTGIRKLALMTQEIIIEAYGVHANPMRSPYVGISFRVEQLDDLKNRLITAAYTYHETVDGLVVDLTKELNLFFVFDLNERCVKKKGSFESK